MQNKNVQRVLGMVLQNALASSLTDEQLVRAYVREQSTEAFVEIIRRYGSMVFGVCQRVLRQQQDAEDAFQATFLVFVRKAKSVRVNDSLGRWLYGVAVRTAQKAKSRRFREESRRDAFSETVSPTCLSSEPLDWLLVLDQELNRLPERERSTIVLCDLLGKSRREAAEELGVPEGTLSSRLARARDHLKSLLERRGVVPAISSAGLIAATSEVSASLVESCMWGVRGSVQPRISQLAEGVIQNMLLQSMMRPVLLTVTAAFICVTTLWWYSPKPNQAPKNIAIAAEPEKSPEPKEKAVEKQDKLTALRKELLDELKIELEALELRLPIGRDPFINLFHATNRVMEVEMDLARNRKEKLEAIEANLKRLTKYQKVIQLKFNAGTCTRGDLASAISRRLEIEILLEQEKAK
jgi:RNA polymerase sigma factor (sigma-70 family)